MKKLPVLILLLAAGPAQAADRAAIDRAIERGVAAVRQRLRTGQFGPVAPLQLGRAENLGAATLIGLTLLECGAAADDADVKRAAKEVREASVSLTYTYAISLAIVFLDRIGDPKDVPLIESLMVRLMAGQDGTGGWSYDCPAISDTEQRRLQTGLKSDRDAEGGDRREAAKKPGEKRSPKDLPDEIKAQLARVDAAAVVGATYGGMGRSDNSNTQFAALALWVGRRHGLPVERAIARLEERFRGSQADNGGWGYMPVLKNAMRTPDTAASASMTCAGILSLAIANGAHLEWVKEHKANTGRMRRAPDIGKDQQLKKALLALSSVIGDTSKIESRPRFGSGGFAPGGAGAGPGGGNRPPGSPDFARRAANRVAGRTYYFLWSLERVAVALDLDTIGKKDWYDWGAEILLANQNGDGSWTGGYGYLGADTCFALLFLRRANLLSDLTSMLKGRLRDPGERVLRAHGGATAPRETGGGLRSGIERKEPTPKPEAKLPETESGRLADDFLKATGAQQLELLEKMRSAKGVKYTEALATAIPRLDGELRQKARDALAQRLTRMKGDTLAQYLEDEDVEIRRAAALACGMKPAKELIPNLIALLRDSHKLVVGAAHAALKELTGQDFGPASGAGREECDRAALKWLTWWGKQHKKSVSPTR